VTAGLPQNFFLGHTDDWLIAKAIIVVSIDDGK
jgi:hypothetical protein